MEQYIYPALIGAGELIVLLVLLILIFKNKKVQETLGKFFKFIGKSNSENNGNPSSVRLNQFYATTILISCVAFGFVWVVTHDNLSGIIFMYLGSIITYLLTLAGFKNWGKSIEANNEIEFKKADKDGSDLQPTETKTVNTTSSTVTTGVSSEKTE